MTPGKTIALTRQNILNENELDTAFEEIVNIIKSSKVYNDCKLNVATITLDKAGIKMSVDYHDLDARIYKIKKEWVQNII